MKREIVFASANAGKIREIAAILPNGFRLSGLRDIGITEDIPETGETILQNSLLKAQFAARRIKELGRDLPVFADDSGLEVEALNRAPGVHSARYAGEPKDDAANIRKLLHELRNATHRQARFVTVITLILNNSVHTFEGEVKGTIALEPRGTNGFGYDPVFIPQGYRSTFAEVAQEVKNSISHRRMAMEKLLEFLRVSGR